MSQSIPIWCWYCKREIPAAADTCPYCGKPLNDATKVVQCRKCGKFLLKNTPRCLQCGEPTPQPEPPVAPSENPAPPDEAPAQEAGVDAPPPIGFPESGPETAVGVPETMSVFEELELLSARTAKHSAEANAAKRRTERFMTIIAAVLLLAVGAGIFIGVGRMKAKAPRPGEPVYCDEGKHEWREADCTTPKTCAICGKTEGEPVGHRYVENVCAVCGAYQMRFYFTDSRSERNAGEVIFHGTLKNYTGEKVQSLQIRLQLYDEKKELVETLPGAAMESVGLAPLESTEWQIRYDDSSVKWKYWRVYVSDYTPEA